jgi:hypothetical protein
MIVVVAGLGVLNTVLLGMVACWVAGPPLRPR